MNIRLFYKNRLLLSFAAVFAVSLLVFAFFQESASQQQHIISVCQDIATDKRPKVLHLTHHWGGGIEHHAENLCDVLAPQVCSLRLMPHTNLSGDRGAVILHLGKAASKHAVIFNLPEDYALLCTMLKKLGISGVHVHHMIQLPSVLLSLPYDLGIPHVVKVHDYWWLNGNPKLTDEAERFQERYRHDLSLTKQLPKNTTLKGFQACYRSLFENAKAVIFASQDVRDRFGKDVYAIKKSVVAYDPYFKDVEKTPVQPFKSRKSYRIGLLGAMPVCKGAAFAQQAADAAQKQRLPLEFMLLGYTHIKMPHVRITGEYKNDDILDLIKKHNIDVLLYCAQWPETYSQTLSYGLLSGLPIAAVNLGAFPERLAGRAHTMLFDYQMNPAMFPQLLMGFIKKLEKGLPCVAPAWKKPLAVKPNFYQQAYTALFKDGLSVAEKNRDSIEKISWQKLLQSVHVAEKNA